MIEKALRFILVTSVTIVINNFPMIRNGNNLYRLNAFC